MVGEDHSKRRWVDWVSGKETKAYGKGKDIRGDKVGNERTETPLWLPSTENCYLILLGRAQLWPHHDRRMRTYLLEAGRPMRRAPVVMIRV